jgi:hypothetical protein
MLAARTQVSGTKTAGVEVIIPRDVTIDLQTKSKDIRIDGSGRLKGFVLTRADVGNFDRPTVIAVDGKACDTDGACVKRSVRTFTRGNRSSQVAKLSKGRYILYLVADDEPVNVRINIPELEGSSDLRPTGPVYSGIGQPQPAIAEGTNTVYSNGQTVDFEGPSPMWMTFMTMSGDAWAAGGYGHCIYQGVMPPPPIGFAPGCPAGGGVVIGDLILQPVPYEKDAGSLTFAGEGGRWSFGDYYVSAAKADAPKTLSFFLDVERI